LLYLLIDKNRAAWIAEIASRFSYFADKMRGVDRGRVISAVELSQDQKTKLEDVLDRHSEHDIALTYETDPGLIAGLVVKIGDHVIDGSAAHRLELFRRALLGARVTVGAEAEAGE
jgi:F-type H+-transporting ATPase subunit delta